MSLGEIELLATTYTREAFVLTTILAYLLLAQPRASHTEALSFTRPYVLLAALHSIEYLLPVIHG